MAVGLYELDTARLIRRLLAPGGHFVDCGANLGYFSLLAARRVGRLGRVDAFEPDPQNRTRLQAHVALNHADAVVRVHAAALADRVGKLQLHHPDPSRANHGQASLFADLAPGGESFDVPLVRLDQAIERVPDLIKMDVEGAELLALRGAESLLVGDRPPSLIIEHNPVTARAAGFAPGDLLRFLRQLDARWRARWIGAALSQPLSPSQLDGISREGNLLFDHRG
jgi:FkbM family methyltransferase